MGDKTSLGDQLECLCVCSSSSGSVYGYSTLVCIGFYLEIWNNLGAFTPKLPVRSLSDKIFVSDKVCSSTQAL